MLVIAIVLFFVGLCLGSFVNATVWRLHEHANAKRSKKGIKKANLSIVSGRSICPHCKHQLSALDLIPVFSWLFLRGKCRYCHKPIPDSPLVELTMGIVFAGSYLFWPHTVGLDGQWILLSTWLAASVGLLVLAVYDLRWMILPNRVIYPTLLLSVIGRLGYLTAFEKKPLHALLMWAFSIIISSGVFLALFLYSKGKWIGYGDVRLGLITGTLLGDPQKSLLMIFLASFIGTLLVIPDLLRGKKTMSSKLSYGPLLIAATTIIIIFGDSLLNWYKNLLDF
jgi:leader peptidase (prepilin peptidase)/N-methyltransferase